MCATLLLVSGASFGQFEISMGTSYEVPLGEMGDIYVNSPAFQLGLLKTQKYKNKRTSWGIVLGYSSMKPRMDTLYFEVETNNGIEYGEIHYEDYTTYQLMMTGRYDIMLPKKFEFFYGYDAGLHYTNFKYYKHDPYSTDYGQEITSRVVVCPKLGVSLALSEHFAVSVYSRYTFSLGMVEDPKNIVNQYLAAGLVLGLRL